MRTSELLPPETMTCGCCRNSVSFGSNWCPACGAGIEYRRNTPMRVIAGTGMMFVLPFVQVLLFPELVQRLGWPAVIGISLGLSGVVAWWAFRSFWPTRNNVRVKFYRLTYAGYSPKSTDEEDAENDLPLTLLVAVPVAAAIMFLANQLSHALLGFFDADTGDLAFRLMGCIAIYATVVAMIVAEKRGVFDWLKHRRRNRFFA